MNAALSDIDRLLEPDTIERQLAELERLPRRDIPVDAAADQYHPAVAGELLDAADRQGTDLVVPEDVYEDVVGAMNDARDATGSGLTDALFDRGWNAYQAGKDRDPAGEALGILTTSYVGGLGAAYAGAQTGNPVIGAAAMIGTVTAGKVGVVLGEQYWSGYRAAAAVDAAERAVAQYQADDKQYWLVTDASYDPEMLRDRAPSMDTATREDNMEGVLTFVDEHAPGDLSAEQRERYVEYLEN